VRQSFEERQLDGGALRRRENVERRCDGRRADASVQRVVRVLRRARHSHRLVGVKLRRTLHRFRFAAARAHEVERARSRHHRQPTANRAARDVVRRGAAPCLHERFQHDFLRVGPHGHDP